MRLITINRFHSTNFFTITFFYIILILLFVLTSLKKNFFVVYFKYFSIIHSWSIKHYIMFLWHTNEIINTELIYISILFFHLFYYIYIYIFYILTCEALWAAFYDCEWFIGACFSKTKSILYNLSLKYNNLFNIWNDFAPSSSVCLQFQPPS